MKLKPITIDQLAEISDAISLLRVAREKLKMADAPRSVEKVRAALKSAEGAFRHGERRLG